MTVSDRFEALLDAVLGLTHLSDVSVSAEGSRAAVVAEPAYQERDQGAASRIWIVEAGTPPVQATSGPNSDRLPRWSPVDDSMAFASDRDHRGRMSLYLVGPGHDGASPLGAIDGFVEAIAWSPLGGSVYVLAADAGLDAAAVNSAQKLQEGDEDPRVERPSTARRRLFRVDVASGQTDEVGPADVSIWEFDLLDDETAAAVVSTDPNERGWYRAHLAVLDLSARTHREVYRPGGQIQSPAISPSGARMAVTEGWSSDRGLVAGQLKAIVEGDVVDLSEHTGDVTWAQWRDEETLWFAGFSDFGSRFGVVDTTGSIVWAEDDAGTVGSSSFLGNLAPVPGDGHRFFAVREATGQPVELATGKVGGSGLTPISEFNSEALAKVSSYPSIDEIEWDAADGERIRGLLMVPAGARQPLPLVVDVHGGPTYAMKHAFNPGNALPLTGAGYAVLLPNYRGSVGRGQRFTRLNVGDPAGREFEDVTRGVAACVDRGVADGDRVGIMGASYGGYLTAWAAATSDVFSAAVVISGISDLLSCYHTCNNPPFYELMLEGTPYDPDMLPMYMDRSPIAHVAGASTPTLLLHGADDLCTPVGQAQEFYQALAEQGVPAELVIYPREGHGFREQDHQIDSWRRVVAWFDQHLGGGSP